MQILPFQNELNLKERKTHRNRTDIVLKNTLTMNSFSHFLKCMYFFQAFYKHLKTLPPVFKHFL